jgi:hypothetical protein
MVRINYRSADDTPRQAWLVSLGDNSVDAVVGSGVKHDAGWLYEGGWARTEHPRELSLAGVYLGSGAVWDGSCLSLIAPSHSAEAVYVLRVGGNVFASNSLPFVLCGGKVENFPIRDIGPIMRSIKAGMTKYERLIHSTPQWTLWRFCNSIVECRLGVDPVEHQQQADVSQITSFNTYQAYLLSIIGEAARTYGSTGTTVYLSRGYDSTACAVLASQLEGDKLALSVDKGRHGVRDDGTEAAKLLGMRTRLLQRPERVALRQTRQGEERVNRSDIERMSEFYIGMSLLDEILLADDELLAGRTVLMGFHGDKVWDPTVPVSDDLKRGDVSGASLTDFRVRVGYLQIPVPMLAFRAQPFLAALALSNEMRPWRSGKLVGIGRWRVKIPLMSIKLALRALWLPRRVREWAWRGTYDRPIPRRIAEDAGLPRHMFGQNKAAAAMVTPDESALADDLFGRLLSRYRKSAGALRPIKTALSGAPRPDIKGVN